MKKIKIAFPIMANYSIPINYLLNKILDCEIINTPSITKRTIELGTRYSPEFVCTPFKYTLGSFIESLDMGASILIQQGGGCRYGYYSEVQNEILKDLGYKFKMINLVCAGKLNIKRIYKELNSISKINIIKSLYYFINTRYIIKYMDIIDDYIRKNIGFEIEEDKFKKINDKFLKEVILYNNIIDIYKCYKKTMRELKNVKLVKPNKIIRIGLIGELYTLMEPFTNYNLEIFLAKKGIEITRFTNVDYLLFRKRKEIKNNMKNSKYVKYKMGADASGNICFAEYLCKRKYDGIIHIKSTFCTPEIAAIPIINKVCKDYKVSIMFMSFDSNTSEEGIKTRLEAFYDMLEMNK